MPQPVPRRLNEDGARARINLHVVNAVFQSFPGLDDEAPVSGVRFEITVNGETTSIGITGDDGEVSIVMPASAQNISLVALGTTYPITPSLASSGQLYAERSIQGIQQRLNMLGYNAGPVDGQIGKLGEYALLNFQADQGLIVHGLPDRATIEEIRGKIEELPLRHIVHPVQRIVPLVFVRCRQIVNQVWRPDLDNRGFGEERGAIVGVCQNDTAQVTVVRRMLDPTAPLFAVSEDDNLLRIDPAYQQIADGERAHIRFHAGNTAGQVRIYIHGESATGPTIGLIVVQISELITLPIAVHRTSIIESQGSPQHAAPDRQLSLFRANMVNVNMTWRPLGIQFEIVSERQTQFGNQVPIHGTVPAAGELLVPPVAEWENSPNVDRLLRTNPVTNCINIYLIREIVTHSGRQSPSGVGSAATRSAIISDLCSLRGIAHEFGHILNIASHADDSPGPSHNPHERRHDLWSRRRLMYFTNGLLPENRVDPDHGRYSFDANDVGYGIAGSGVMLTIKNLRSDNTDDEHRIARESAEQFNRGRGA